MRVCLIEVGHWHSPYYYGKLSAQGIAVAAVSDHTAAVAKIPFGMEKPLGLSSAEVGPLAEQARRTLNLGIHFTEAADGTACRIETGYALPGGAKGRAMEFVLRGRQGYYEVREEEMLWVDRDAQPRPYPRPTDQTSFYAGFVQECLDALREGRRPVADIQDNLAALKLVEAAYRAAQTKQVIEL
jgi:hypothetical protein